MRKGLISFTQTVETGSQVNSVFWQHLKHSYFYLTRYLFDYLIYMFLSKPLFKEHKCSFLPTQFIDHAKRIELAISS